MRNDEAARQGRPDTSSITRRKDSKAGGALVRIREALEDGDVDFAGAIIDSALEDGPSTRQHRCQCGAAFEWPGLLDDHRRRSGHEPLSWRAAA